MNGDLMRMADPQLALELLGTVRYERDGLVDHLAEPRATRAWLTRRVGGWLEVAGLSDAALTGLARFRDQLRTLFTAVVDDAPPPPTIVATVNAAAERGPATLAAGWTADGALDIVRIVASGDDPEVALRGEFARAALALLAADQRDRLRLCRAPRCVLFFLKEHPRQEWCSPGCGNRARVARHYARHRAEHTQ